ncbi:MAG: hypothetical protein MUF24_02715 [Chitinophagaceae bacterium]|jgi:hypothetical protein|nr:hypothetical protein [Chitinophagaceae bacterium]
MKIGMAWREIFFSRKGAKVFFTQRAQSFFHAKGARVSGFFLFGLAKDSSFHAKGARVSGFFLCGLPRDFFFQAKAPFEARVMLLELGRPCITCLIKALPASNKKRQEYYPCPA